jgi:hypothetical protein
MLLLARAVDFLKCFFETRCPQANIEAKYAQAAPPTKGFKPRHPMTRERLGIRPLTLILMNEKLGYAARCVRSTL